MNLLFRMCNQLVFLGKHIAETGGDSLNVQRVDFDAGFAHYFRQAGGISHQSRFVVFESFQRRDAESLA